MPAADFWPPISRSQMPGSQTISIVDFDAQAMLAEIRVRADPLGGLRSDAQVFYCEHADPAQIVHVDARNPGRFARWSSPFPSAGSRARPRLTTHRSSVLRLGRLISGSDTQSGKVMGRQSPERHPSRFLPIARRRQFYVASADSGRDRVFDTATMESLGRIRDREGSDSWSSRPSATALCVSCAESARRSIRSATPEPGNTPGRIGDVHIEDLASDRPPAGPARTRISAKHRHVHRMR